MKLSLFFFNIANSIWVKVLGQTSFLEELVGVFLVVDFLFSFALFNVMKSTF